MTEIPIDRDPSSEMPRTAATTAAIEAEITKRRLIEAVTSVVLVILYMVFAALRDRDPGVVALDGSDDWDDGQ